MYACILTQKVPAWDTPMKGGRAIGWVKPGYVRGNAPVNSWAQLALSIRDKKGKTYSPVYARVKHLKGYKAEAVAPPIEPPVEPPSSRVWWFVKFQWQRADASEYHGRDNLPMVFRMGDVDNTNNGHYTRLTRDWQFFWFDLFCFVYFHRYHDELTKEEYRWLANRWTSVGAGDAAFCNKHGLNDCRNYVTGENADAEDPAIYTLVCSGASLDGVAGDKVLKVAHFDGAQPPPDVRTIDPYSDPRVFFATTGGDYHVYPFPQLGGLDVPVPIIASKDVYFSIADLERYEAPTKRKPYYP